MQIFDCFGYLCGLKWVKICWQIDTKEKCLDGLFWVRVKHWMWIGKKNSINNFICHLSWLKKLSPSHTYPLVYICEFLKPYELLFFKLNVTCIKIHSIILSVTCHGLRNFPLLIHIPSYPFMNFWNSMSNYFLSWSHS